MNNISIINRTKYDNFYSLLNNPLQISEIYFRTMMVNELVKRYSGKTNKKVMDVGFGTGEMFKIFDKDCEIYGIDISKYSKHLFLKNSIKFKKVEIEIKDLNVNPKLFGKKKYFDIIIFSHILEHIRTYKIVLKEAYKIIRKGGIVIIIIPINERRKDKSHLFYFDKSNFIKYLKEIGFKIITSKENFSFPKLPPVICHKRSLINIFKSNMSKLLNFMMILLGYNLLKRIDNLTLRIGFKPSQIAIVVRK